MGWDGSGNVVRNNGTNTGQSTWQDDAAANAKIRSDRHDTHDQDLADAIENTVALDGQTTTTTDNDILRFDSGQLKFVGLSVGTDEIVGRKSGDLTTYAVGQNNGDIPKNSDVDVRVDNRGFAQQVDSVSDLQSGSFPASLDRIWLSGYYGVGTAGGGPLYRDSSDTTTADNGGTVFVDADGVRWKRVVDTRVTLKQFGAKGDDSTDDGPAVENWLTVVRDDALVGFVESGTYRLTTAITNFLLTSDVKIEAASGARFVFPSGSQIGIEGETVATPTITAAITHRDRSVIVDDTTGVQVGDTFLLDSDQDPGEGRGYTKKEILVVDNVASGTQLDFAHPFNFDHDPATDTLSVTIYRSGRVSVRGVNVDIESGATGGFRYFGIKGVHVTDASWSSTAINNGLDGTFAQACVDLLWERIEAKDMRYAVLPNYCRDVRGTDLIGRRINHFLTPSIFCDGVYGDRMYGESCTGLLDSHASFDVHYSNVKSVNEVSGSNLRSYGGSLRNVTLHVDSASAVEFPLYNALSDSANANVEERELVVEDFVSRYNSGLNDISLPQVAVTKQRYSGVTCRKLTQTLLNDNDMAFSFCRAGFMQLRSNFTVPMDNCKISKTTYGSDRDELLKLNNLYYLKAVNCFFEGSDYFVDFEQGASGELIRNFTNCHFKDIATRWDDSAAANGSVFYRFNNCTFDNVSAFGSDALQGDFRNVNARYINGSAELNSENSGSVSDTTDGSGDVTVTHNLHSTPATVSVTPKDTTFHQLQVHSVGASSFKVRSFGAGGSAETSTEIDFDWHAEL